MRRRRLRCSRKLQERCLGISIRQKRAPLGSAERPVAADWVEFEVHRSSRSRRASATHEGSETRRRTRNVPSCQTSTGLPEPLTGQRIRILQQPGRWMAPMLYHNISLQPCLRWVASSAGIPGYDRRGKDAASLAGRIRTAIPLSLATWGSPMSDAAWSETLCENFEGEPISVALSSSREWLDGRRGASLQAMLAAKQ